MLETHTEKDNPDVDSSCIRHLGCLFSYLDNSVVERWNMHTAHAGATLTGIRHHHVEINGTTLHYVSAGTSGSPVLLVHGFPETWWAFHKLIPLLAAKHRVFAADLRGFGDSANGQGDYDSKTSSEDLHQLIAHLDVGPVHLTGQDISGATVFRLAATHPENVLSLTAIEMGLPGFGMEGLADVTHGGAWYIGFLAAPGVPEMLLAGRERDFLTKVAYPAMCAVPDAVTVTDLDEFVRTYSRPDGWRGAIGLYQSMLKEGLEIKALAQSHKVNAPVLTIGAGGGPFTANTMAAVTTSVHSVLLDGVGHYAAMEAPEPVAQAMEAFIESVDQQ
jgi:pimeloyl-ACP methyl ester carboxylesterase